MEVWVYIASGFPTTLAVPHLMKIHYRVTKVAYVIEKLLLALAADCKFRVIQKQKFQAKTI